MKSWAVVAIACTFIQLGVLGLKDMIYILPVGLATFLASYLSYKLGKKGW